MHILFLYIHFRLSHFGFFFFLSPLVDSPSFLISKGNYQIQNLIVLQLQNKI